MAHKRAINVLFQSRFPFPFDVSRFIDQALRSTTDTESAFQLAFALILRSPQFRARFPGIFKRDGTLRINPEEYLRREENFASTAALYGFNLGRAHVGRLVGFDVDPQEFELRAKAVQTLRANPTVLEQFRRQVQDANQVRSERGLPALPDISSTRDAVNFLLGRGNRQVYELYEAAQLVAVAEEQGLKVGRGRARQLARGTPGVLSPGQTKQAFETIAQALSEGGVELGIFGLNQQDVEDYTLGIGKPGTGEKLRQALKQAQAATKPKARIPVVFPGGRPTVIGPQPEAV